MISDHKQMLLSLWLLRCLLSCLRHHMGVIAHLGPCSPTTQHVTLLTAAHLVERRHSGWLGSAKCFETPGWKVPLWLVLTMVICWFSPSSASCREGRYRGKSWAQRADVCQEPQQVRDGVSWASCDPTGGQARIHSPLPWPFLHRLGMGEDPCAFCVPDSEKTWKLGLFLYYVSITALIHMPAVPWSALANLTHGAVPAPRDGCIGNGEEAALPCLRLEHECLLAILWAVPVIRHGTALLAAPSSWACSGRCDALGNPVWEGRTPCHLLAIYTPRLAFSACLAPLFLKGNVNIQKMFFETVVSPLTYMQPREFSALAPTKISKT